MPVHLLVASWQPAVAWVVTALSLYSLLWIVGDYQAMRLTPICVTDRKIEVRVGRRWRADIPLDTIVCVKEVVESEGLPNDGQALDLSLIGGADVVLELDDEHSVRGLFGLEKRARTLGLSMDAPQDFIQSIETAKASASHRNDR